ncbi:OmpA family protein [Plesiomonas shigelloides]|uniref:OmpA family protein n=1 Tax=Plesiomonas shigelloides TaxID=703 RepID=UPI00387F101E
MAKDSHHTIIIKKVQHDDHDEGHGGAWKVAFADFAIAMMAFFMVLWVMEVATKDERQKVQQYMATYSVFDNMDNVFDISNSPFPVDFAGQASPLENPVQSNFDGNDKLGNALFQENKSQGQYKNKDLGKLQGKYLNQQQMEVLAEALNAVAVRLDATNNVMVEVVPQGLRILIQDDNEHYMFERGSIRITPFFKGILDQISPVLGSIQNRIMISGHTDNTRYPNNVDYTNWDLSAERALAARRVMTANGMKRDQILQLVAMAEQMPVNIEDPMSGQNRRIEITVLTEQAAAQIAQLFGRANAKPMPPHIVTSPLAPQPNAAPRPAANAVNGIGTVTAPAANGMVPSAHSAPAKSVAPSAAQPATLPPAASAGNHTGKNNAGLPPLLTDQAGNLVRIGIDPILPGMATLTPDHAKPVGQRSEPAAPLKALPVKPQAEPVAPVPEVLLPVRVEHG